MPEIGAVDGEDGRAVVDWEEEWESGRVKWSNHYRSVRRLQFSTCRCENGNPTFQLFRDVRGGSFMGMGNTILHTVIPLNNSKIRIPILILQ